MNLPSLRGPRSDQAAAADVPPFWAESPEALLLRLHTTAEGLSAGAAASRQAGGAANPLAGFSRGDGPAMLLRQFTSPIILMLVGAALLSFALESPADGLIILAIVLVSGLLSYHQEHSAARAMAALMAVVALQTHVLRDGRPTAIPMEAVVPGDVVLLAAGDGIPADCRLLEERDLCVDEAALTGESLPVEKAVAELPADTPLARRRNVLHLGTHVVSGTGRAVVVLTGRSTAYGAIADRLRPGRGETEFERGVRRFGNLLVEITLVLIALIFAFNVLLKRPVVDSFLFALALGVGLTPQLLPAIISVNLAHGARGMARRRVIVKRLAAIENFGGMDVLCSDKTGTLTEGRMQLVGALAADGHSAERVLQLARLNALFETGFANPIDDALRGQPSPGAAAVSGVAEGSGEPLAIEAAAWIKLDERPFDFHRKRQSVLLRAAGSSDAQHLLVTKGSLATVLEVCSLARDSQGRLHPLADQVARIRDLSERHGQRGERVLAVASRLDGGTTINADSEQDLTFEGLLLIADPLRPGIAATIADLATLGVRLKIISGDSAAVAERIARQAGLADPVLLRGSDLQSISDAALPRRVAACDVFAEVEPTQKARLISALRRAGHVVGYLGDGINDAPALQAADVGLSVQGAVAVAREAADIVLLDPDLAVLTEGIREGRRCFANTIKYVLMASSANFGNMISMAAASLLLPFLPLLPKQILLTNLLTDLPEMTIATDRVDPEWIERPRRWDLPLIRRFMLGFGLLSSLFDALTFSVLLALAPTDPVRFRSGWFVESVLSAALVVLVLRTRRPLLASHPSASLTLATLLICLVTVLLPFTPIAPLFGFGPLPLPFLGAVAAILVAYGLSAVALRRVFYRRFSS